MSKTLSKLTKIHIDAMNLRLNGSSIKEIAVALNKSEAAIRLWFYSDDLFREEFSKIKEESVERAKTILQGAAAAAAKRIVELMYQDRGGQVNLAAANSILDRIGLKEVPMEDQGGKTVLDNSLDKLLSEVAEQEKDNGEEGEEE